MASHSSILAWRIPWTGEPGGCKESDATEHTAHTVPGAVLSAGVNHPFQHHLFQHSTHLGKKGQHRPRWTGGRGVGGGVGHKATSCRGHRVVQAQTEAIWPLTPTSTSTLLVSPPQVSSPASSVPGRTLAVLSPDAIKHGASLMAQWERIHLQCKRQV